MWSEFELTCTLLASQEALRRKDTPAVRTNRDRLVAARLAFEENSREFFEQSLTRLVQTGKNNDNLMQRARKAYEAFAEYRTLYVDSENQVNNHDWY